MKLSYYPQKKFRVVPKKEFYADKILQTYIIETVEPIRGGFFKNRVTGYRWKRYSDSWQIGPLYMASTVPVFTSEDVANEYCDELNKDS